MTAPATALSIPALSDGTTLLEAALAYAKAGWRVLPIDPADKHPGSLLGNGWPAQTSRDPARIIAWFNGQGVPGQYQQAGPASALALHHGVSGSIAFDLDRPDAIPADLAKAIEECRPPYQVSDPANPGRGHYLFACEPGQYGSSGGGLGEEWGEVRGLNAVTVVAPTCHSVPGHVYSWQRAGELPWIPDYLARHLHPPGGASDSVDMAAARAYVDAFPPGPPCPAVSRVDLTLPLSGLHPAVTKAQYQLVLLGEQGHHGAAEALQALEEAFDATAPDAEHPRAKSQAAREWGRGLRGAVAKVLAGPTAEADKGCCGSRQQDATLAALGFRPDELAQATDPAVVDVQQPAMRREPADYFGKDVGLLVSVLARDVLGMGPLAQGADDRLWRYEAGVWKAAPHVVRERCVWLMRDRFRRSHATNAEDVIRALVPTITSDPIEEYINLRNGLLDWRTGELRPHDSAVLSTVQLAVDYDPDAACPEFEAWLAQVVPVDCVALVWELIAYLLYSGNPLHTAVMLVGKGRNGKGTLLRVITAILGAGNITSASLHDLVNTRFTTASLFGKIANIAGDIDGNYIENTATFKAITGQDMISAEHKGRDRFDFTPWAVPVFSANKIPPSADTTAGYLSRWLIVPFPHSFEGHEDRTLDARLHTPSELAGIVTKALGVLPGLLERGHFHLPASAQQARAEFERKVDQVRAWMAEGCDRNPAHPHLNRRQLYAAYQGWVLADGGKPVKASEFYDRLEAAGVQAATVKGVRGFKGIAVRSEGSPHRIEPTAGGAPLLPM